MRRRGVTLVELLIALVLFALVGALLTRTSLGLARALRALETRAAAQSTLDVGTGWLASELEELGAGDLTMATGDVLRYRGVRHAGLACAISATSVTFVPQRGTTGRSPQAGRDSLLLLVDTAWHAFAVHAVSAGHCDAASAFSITTAIDSTDLRHLRNLWTPVRLFEGMQARFYTSGGAWWLGGRSESAGEGLQPLAGPFRNTLPVWTATAASVSINLTDSSAADSARLFLAFRNQP